MSWLLIFLSFSFINLSSQAQSPDFISVKKKNDITLKIYRAGLPITFETQFGATVSGPIEDIRNDSLFVKIYDRRVYMTNLGITKLDTINIYISGFHYKDIKRIRIYEKKRFIRSKIHRLLIYGGAGYFILNIANGAFFDSPLTDKKNLRRLGISLGAIGTGILIRKFFGINNYSRKKHRIVYVNMK
ncbi:MAG: hypothetical protein JJE22_18715 [Bacteroidia bacterium]|nr:hypothetical protein [Bacteroidia bacterium]